MEEYINYLTEKLAARQNNIDFVYEAQLSYIENMISLAFVNLEFIDKKIFFYG